MQKKGIACKRFRRLLHVGFFAAMIILAVALLRTPVYGKNASKKEIWTVTQYGREDAPRQSMFYTVVNSSGKLMVIDGGWRYEADTVRSVIRSLGNKVAVWIITHPHPDHVGALTEILGNNYTNISIGVIYSPKTRAKQYKATQKPWDEYSIYEQFNTLAKKTKKLKYLQEGDVRKVLGLELKVLNGWDKSIDQYKMNQCNYGSLMFKLKGQKRSFLFCGDVSKSRGKRIVKKYRKELKSTFVQCGHHGNWGLTKRFYDYVQPKAAFVDAPKSITEDKTGKYDAPALIAYLKEKNIKVYKYASGKKSVQIW